MSNHAVPHHEHVSALNVFYPRGVFMQQSGFYATDYSLAVNPGAQYKSEYTSGYSGHEPGAAHEIGYGCPGATTTRSQEQIDRMDPSKNHSPYTGIYTTVEKPFESQQAEAKLDELTRPCPCPADNHGADKKLNLPKEAGTPKYMTEKHAKPATFCKDPTSYQKDFGAPIGAGNFTTIKIADGEGTGFSKTQSKLKGVGSGDDKPDYSTSYQNDYNNINERCSSVYQ